MLQQELRATARLREVGDLFGRDFAEALSSLELVTSRKAGRVLCASAYGWHLVRLIESRRRSSSCL